MIAIIDYDAGNIKSVEKAVIKLGYDCVITRDREVLKNADKLILPGVGAFKDAMDKLNEYGLSDVIKELVTDEGKPLQYDDGRELAEDILRYADHVRGRLRGNPCLFLRWAVGYL